VYAIIKKETENKTDKNVFLVFHTMNLKISPASATNDASVMHKIQLLSYTKDLWETADVISQIVSISDGYSLIACDGHEIVGYVLAHPFSDPKNPVRLSNLQQVHKTGKYFFIHDLCVTPDARGKGVAAKILKDLMDRAFEGGFLGVYLVSLAHVKDFWRAFGFIDYTEPTTWDYKEMYGENSQYMVYSP
jgi:predicted N-acetyltransferase YhbS